MNLAGIAALAGMREAQASVEASAGRLAKAGAQAVPVASGGGGGDIVDLSAEMVALMQAKNFHAAMVTVAQTADEMDSHLVNLLG